MKPMTTEEIRELAEPGLVATQTTGDHSPADVAPVPEVTHGQR